MALIPVLAAACSSSSPPELAQTSSHTPASTGRASASGTSPCRGTKRVTNWKHVVWIVMENHSFDQIVGSADAPYENHLATECGVALAYHAVAHPSLPNYIALTSGGTQGIVDDDPPPAHPLSAASIFSQLDTGWKALQESMPSNCDQASSGAYAVKHNPAAYFTGIRQACNSQDLPLGSPPDLSARFTFVTPNICHDMHDCSVATGDGWLAQFLPSVLGSAQYRAGRTAVFITWDEDDGSADNHVAAFVIAPTVPPGTRSNTTFSHYSLLRTTEEMLGLDLLGGAATAPSMRSAFGL